METKDIIKELRKKHNFSAQQVADGCDMSLGVYKKYESGERGVGVPALSKLADFYNVSTDYLLGRDNIEQTALDELAGQFNMSLLEKKIVENYFELPEKMRGDLMAFLERSVKEVAAESAKIAESKNKSIYLKASRSADNHGPEIVILTPEERKRLDEAPDETQNPDNDL